MNTLIMQARAKGDYPTVGHIAEWNEDLEKAAKAKDDAAITAANTALTATCGGCHTAHRERLPDMSFEIK